MKVNKKVLGTLNKCYALAQVEFDGKNYLACAAEKRTHVTCMIMRETL